MLLRRIAYSIVALLVLVISTMAQERKEIRSLEAGRAVQQEINQGETHYYQITLTAGQYLRVVAEQEYIDVKLTLFGPRGEKLVEVDVANFILDRMTNASLRGFASAAEAETLSFPAKIAGAYRLEVQPVKPNAGAGRYVLKTADLRPITAQDRKRIAAQNAFADGERLRALRTKESLRRAIEKYIEALNSWRATSDLIEQSHALDRLAFTHFELNEKQEVIKWFEQSLSLWRKAQGRRGEAYVLDSIGQVYALQRDLKALDVFDQALRLWQAEGDKRLEAFAHLRCSAANAVLGEPHRAVFHGDEALRLSRAVEDKRMEANILITRGADHDQSEGNRKSLDYINQAIEICRNSAYPVGEANALAVLGDKSWSLGEHQQALDYYDQALRLARKWLDRDLEIYTLIHTGEVYFYLSDYQKAMDYYTEALGPSQAIGNHWGEGYALYDLGRVFELLGEPEKALDHYEQSLPHWRIIGDYDGVAYTFNEIALILDARGEKQRVLELLNEALKLMRYVKDGYGEARTLDNIGMVYSSLREHQKALDYLSQALPLRRAEHDGSGEARTLGNIGIVYHAMGEKQKALDYLNQAMRRYQAITNRSGEADMRYRTARVKREQGNETEARAQVEEALAIAESLRAGVFSRDLRDSYSASVQRYYEFYIDLLMESHKKQPSEGLDRVALNAVERARARGMLEILAESHVDIRQGVDPTLLERERVLRQQLNDKEKRRMQLLSGSPTPQQAEAAEKEIRTILSQYQQIEAEIKAKSPRYAALTQPQPLSVEEVQQQALDSETLLLEYALGEERSFLWAVTQTSIHSFELPGRAEIETAARHVRELLTARQPVHGKTDAERVRRADDEYTREAAHLSRMVLGPAATLLSGKKLLIASDGALHYIPFAALPAPDSNDPLIVKHEIVFVPSGSVLTRLRRELAGRKPAEGMVAVLADPVFNAEDARLRRQTTQTQLHPTRRSIADNIARAVREVDLGEEKGGIARLPLSRQEANSILSFVPAGQGMKAVDFRANRVVATSAELSRYRIVHFATHGLLNSQHPELSGIVLSLVDERGRPQDGFLRLHDVYNLNIPAEVVVLSSCQTALGKEIRGEGLIGLVRGFMYAGAARVVASLWKVDDWSTSELMKRFYKKMISEKLHPSAALRAAQIEMWQQQKWRAPYYWAAFTLQGEPN